MCISYGGRRAGVRNRDHQVRLNRMLARKLPPHLFADFLYRAAINDRVGRRKIYALKNARSGLRGFVPLRRTRDNTVLYGDICPGRNFSAIVGIQKIKRAGLGGKHDPLFSRAPDERAYAEPTSCRIQFLLIQCQHRKGAVKTRKDREERLPEIGPGSRLQKSCDHLGVGLGSKHVSLAPALCPKALMKVQLAVWAERKIPPAFSRILEHSDGGLGIFL